MIACFERLGSLAALVKWAEQNQTEFYKSYFRLAPTEASIDVTVRDETTLTDAELASIATSRSTGATEETSSPVEPSGVH